MAIVGIPEAIHDFNMYLTGNKLGGITGEVEITDETWNSYLEQLNMMDLDTLVEVRQAAYDRWNS